MKMKKRVRIYVTAPDHVIPQPVVSWEPGEVKLEQMIPVGDGRTMYILEIDAPVVISGKEK